MKAMIFAAGLGTRLKPFTLSHPKAMVDVGGEPMLGRVARRLIAAGVDHIVINVHHFAKQIIDYVKECDGFGVKVDISDESDYLLDTGGGILAARKWLGEDQPFIVHNADILSDFDIRDMYKHHVNSGNLSTLLTSDRQTSRYLYFNRDNKKMIGWGNITANEYKPIGFTPENDNIKLAFDGVHVLSPEIFSLLEAYKIDRKFSITSFYIDMCNRYTIGSYIPHGDFNWYDVGSPETLEIARQYISKQ